MERPISGALIFPRYSRISPSRSLLPLKLSLLQLVLNMSGNDEIDSSEDRHKISPTFPPDVEPVSLVGIDATQDTLPFIGEPARGADDVPSVIYLNIIPNFKNARDEVRRLQDANSLGAHYFSVKAAESASARMAKGKLPTSQDIDSQIQRDNYRNLVYDAVLVKSPW